MTTISRISWEAQLFHAPTVLEDLRLNGIDQPHKRHLNVATIGGVAALLRTPSSEQIAILDAIPMLPTMVRWLIKPSKLLSTFGDRHLHVLLERYVPKWLLHLIERLELVDADSSDIVKSSSAKVFGRFPSCVTKLIHIPDTFPPLARKGVTYLYQGNLRWDKGVENIMLYPSREDTLIIIGDGPHRRRLERFAKKVLCETVFTGFVKNPEPFWRMCDVVLNSRGKTRSNEYCEAGLPRRAQAYGKEWRTI